MSDVQHRTLAHGKMRSQWVVVEYLSMYVHNLSHGFESTVLEHCY